MALDVVNAYLDVILQKKIIQVSEDNLKKHKDLLDLTKQRARQVFLEKLI